ncbi:caspase-8 [Stegastes partitus]|uniref:Caspase-8 n=1 Tax=Stegastes partitus TaxID=144197 RepID=A0A3B4Z6M1_9TELE|nr:PREDICTED: caspase-8-like [Stegastes partitus]
MDRRILAKIDDELESTEVAELCFLCRDVISGKRLEGITDAKQLFLRLEEKGLLENNYFLSQLLRTIRRADLLSHIETDSRQAEETDAQPALSQYRMMLYKIYDDMTKENLEKLKFLFNNDQRRKMELCNTALDVFVEMEKVGSLSNGNLSALYDMLREIDQQLASTVQNYMQGVPRQHQPSLPVSVDLQRVNNTPRPQPFLSIPESQLSCESESVYADAQSPTEPSPPPDPDSMDYYALTHNPRGLCVVINNENFLGIGLKSRGGTQEDAQALKDVFTRFGFEVEIHNNLTAGNMRTVIRMLGQRNFLRDDALVVCVLSHGLKDIVYGTDEEQVKLSELTEPFKSNAARTLAGKPKLFFIQACQGRQYQRGAVPCLPTQAQAEVETLSHWEADAGPLSNETVPWDADFLIGMATVPNCMSFRNTATGSIYIQELCRQLRKAAESSEKDDINTVLTRVNREVSRREYLAYKQMPEPKYTLTKKLVLKYVSADLDHVQK